MRSAPDPSRRHREHRERSLARGTSGAVYVEFLLAFLPFFIMVLGMTQQALLFMGHLVVQHAATIAVRAAIVVLPDDPAKYENSPLNTVAAGRDTTQPSAIDAIIGFLGGDSSSASPIPGFGGGSGGGGGGGGMDPSDPRSMYGNRNARMHAIVDAASIPLMSISPSFEQLAPQLFGQGDNVQAGIGRDNPLMRAVSSLLYNKVAVAVTFPTTPGVNQYRNSFDPNGPVTARVTYLFHCAIPIARQLMCDDPISIRLGISPGEVLRIVESVTGSGSPQAAAAAIQEIQLLEARHRAMQPLVAEIATAPWSLAMIATAATGQRFSLMRAEATLPNQGAGYNYTAAGSGTPPDPEDAGTPDAGCRMNFSGCCSHHMAIDGCQPDGTLRCADGWISGCRCNPDGTRACP